MLLGLHLTAFPKPRAEALNQSTSTTLQRKPLLSGECMSCSSVLDVFEPLMWSGKPEQQLFKFSPACCVVMVWQQLQWLGRLNQMEASQSRHNLCTVLSQLCNATCFERLSAFSEESLSGISTVTIVMYSKHCPHTLSAGSCSCSKVW